MLLQEARRKLRFSLLCLLTIIFVCFSISNRQFVHVNLFPFGYSVDMPEFIFALLCLALGVMVGGFFISLKLARVTKLLKSEHRHVNALQNEISARHFEEHDDLPLAKR